MRVRQSAGLIVALLMAGETYGAEYGPWPAPPLERQRVEQRPAVALAVDEYLARVQQPLAMPGIGKPGPFLFQGGLSGEPPEFDRGSEDDETPEEASGRWSSFLPLFGKQARERGYDLPLPLGVGLSLGYLKRKGMVKSVKAALNDNPFQEIQALGFKPDSEVLTVMTRVDAWILPFLNIYGLVGYTWNFTNTEVTIQAPGGTPGTLTTINTELEGPTYGTGVTLAGGLGDFFLTFDWNYVYVDLGGLDSSFSGNLFTARLGWNLEVRDSDLRIWTGATYWDTEREVEGSISLPGGDVLRFRVLQGPRRPWTALFGCNVEMSSVLSAVVEFQFNEYDFMSVVSIGYRF